VATPILFMELFGLRHRMPVIARLGLPPYVEEAEERRRTEEWSRGYALIGQVVVTVCVIGGPDISVLWASSLAGTTITLPDADVLGSILVGLSLLLGISPFALFAWFAGSPRRDVPSGGDPAAVPARPGVLRSVALGLIPAAVITVGGRLLLPDLGIGMYVALVAACAVGACLGHWRRMAMHRAALAAAAARPLAAAQREEGS
jgi:hypothetical protein